MKTTPKIVALLLFMAISAFATAQNISIGLRGGLHLPNVYVTDGIDNLTPDFKSYTAASIAAVAEIGFGQHFAIQPELAYVGKGFKVAEDFALDLFNVPVPVGVTAESRFNYLEMPVLAKVKFGNETVGGYITAGPTLGYALSGRLITRANALVEFKVSDSDINLDAIDYERFEVGAVAGAGLTVNTSFGQLFADARYSRGFTQLYDIPVIDEKIRNQGIAFNIGFLVPIGGKQIRP
ncbi:MAG: porin family protein [Saprospiraceae bacterium]|nr:porin family protein [Saprospiraceae bacterium]